ncbi:MAG: hypothetical protein RI922_2207 [Bacteroidota bacterium]|jgi:hypothetical protein
MDHTQTHFRTENLEIKLTEEKLFITTPTSTETFALRSIDGIGVVDLLDDYNNSLTKFKQNQSNVVKLLGVGILIIAGGVYSLIESLNSESSLLGSFILLFVGLLLTVITIIAIRKSTEPGMLSAVRIMMSGGNRDFVFDKASANSIEFAEFVANVEDTLTAFHKKD